MDPELMQLFINAQNNVGSTSQLMKLLEDPRIAYLAGVYDPTTEFGGSNGQLIGKYKGDPNYPAVNKIISLIEGGADPYYLKSYISAMAAKGEDTDSFQSEDLSSLASAMYKEYTGGSSGGRGGASGRSWWQKSGIPNPLEQYDETNVPSTVYSAMARAGLSKKEQDLQGKQTQARKATSQARKGLSALYGKEFTTPQLLDYLRNTEEGRRMVKENNIDLNKVDIDTGEIYDWATSRGDRPERSMFDPRNLSEAIGANIVSQTSRALETYLKQGVRGNRRKTLGGEVGLGKAEDPLALYAYEQAKADEAALQNQSQKQNQMDEAIRRGTARAYRERGATPTSDSMKAVLRLATKLK